MRASQVERGATTAQLKNVEVPECGPTDVLIRVKSVILGPEVVRFIESGSLSQAPNIPGHKFAGVIAGTGELVTNVKIGQKVRLDPNLSCGSCVFQ